MPSRTLQRHRNTNPSTGWVILGWGGWGVLQIFKLALVELCIASTSIAAGKGAAIAEGLPANSELNEETFKAIFADEKLWGVFLFNLINSQLNNVLIQWKSNDESLKALGMLFAASVPMIPYKNEGKWRLRAIYPNRRANGIAFFLGLGMTIFPLLAIIALNYEEFDVLKADNPHLFWGAVIAATVGTYFTRFYGVYTAILSTLSLTCVYPDRKLLLQVCRDLDKVNSKGEAKLYAKSPVEVVKLLYGNGPDSVGTRRANVLANPVIWLGYLLTAACLVALPAYIALSDKGLKVLFGQNPGQTTPKPIWDVISPTSVTVVLGWVAAFVTIALYAVGVGFVLPRVAWQLGSQTFRQIKRGVGNGEPLRVIGGLLIPVLVCALIWSAYMSGHSMEGLTREFFSATVLAELARVAAAGINGTFTLKGLARVTGSQPTTRGIPARPSAQDTVALLEAHDEGFSFNSANVDTLFKAMLNNKTDLLTKAELDDLRAVTYPDDTGCCTASCFGNGR